MGFPSSPHSGLPHEEARYDSSFVTQACARESRASPASCPHHLYHSHQSQHSTWARSSYALGTTSTSAVTGETPREISVNYEQAKSGRPPQPGTLGRSQIVSDRASVALGVYGGISLPLYGRQGSPAIVPRLLGRRASNRLGDCSVCFPAAAGSLVGSSGVSLITPEGRQESGHSNA